MIFFLSKCPLKVLRVSAFLECYAKLQDHKNILLRASSANFEGLLHGITFLTVVKQLNSENFNVLKAMILILFLQKGFKTKDFLLSFASNDQQFRCCIVYR